MLARAVYQQETTESSRKQREELLYKIRQQTHSERGCLPLSEWVCWALLVRA
jgi:hypothetical protein